MHEGDTLIPESLCLLLAAQISVIDTDGRVLAEEAAATCRASDIILLTVANDDRTFGTSLRD